MDADLATDLSRHQELRRGRPMRVVLATDGSAAAATAVELVGRIEWPTSSTIRVIEAIETGPGLFGGPWPALALVQAARLEATLRQEAEETVRHAAAELARPDLIVEPTVLRGRPASAIVDEANRMSADLIVVGSRGHGAIESMVLGSVSAEVVDHAAVPVLVARGRQAEQVILAWDGSASASRAAALLGAWPIFTRVRVRVVSVADVKIPWWSGMVEPESVDLLPVYVDAIAASRVQHEQLAGEMAARLREAGLQAESLRPEGDAATQILAAARAWPADIIVLGTHGRTGLARLVLGSVARNVLHHAPCSVLVVREPAAVRSMPDAPPEG